MNIVFLTCYYDHHQSELSDALYLLTNKNFRLVETDEIEEERLKLGWSRESIPCYVLNYANNRKEARKLIMEADVVIWGSSPKKLVFNRLLAGKMTLRYSERLFKKGTEGFQYTARAIKYKLECWPSRNLYLLSAGAYAASDYYNIKAIKTAYKWGYFPPFQMLNEDQQRSSETLEILWVGRLIDWKHPEYAIRIADYLKKKGYRFELKIIGNGVMESLIKKKIEREHLGDCVHMLGSMDPNEVRNHMNKADIYLFTSDRNEGWGAVLNEAMNSKCAVVACDAIGSVPYMIRNGQNGLLFHEGDFDDFIKQVEYLVNSPDIRKKLGKAAYMTIRDEWNAGTAAARLIELIHSIKNNEDTPFQNGPCSKAQILYY